MTEIYDDPIELAPYEQEIQAVENMYKSIWNFHIYVDVAHIDKSAIVAMVAEDQLELANDPLLKNESDEGLLSDLSVYDVLATRKSEFAFDQLPQLVAKIDTAAPLTRFRRRGRKPARANIEDLHAIVSDAIASVADELSDRRKSQTKRPRI